MGLKSPAAGIIATIFALAFAAAPVAIAHAAAPERIVSLAPSVTETLFALGAGDEVVGVSQYCDYPPAATKLPKVGSFLTPNVEAIVALRPTLVIGLGLSSDQREIRAIRDLGCAVMMVEDDSLQQIEDSIAKVGDRIGRGDTARALLEHMRAQIADIQMRSAKEPRPRVLMLVGHQPLVAVGRGTYLDDILRVANADNIADESSQQWPHLDIEYIIAMRPDVILDGQMGTDSATPSRFWERYATIPAVRNHRVYGYPEDPILHPGPRVATSLAMIAAMIHPDAFAKDGGASR